MTTLLPLLQIANTNSWENPQLPSLNKLSPHAPFYPFPTAEEALNLTREQSPWFLPLNGLWDFQIKSRPEEVTPSVLTSKKWTTIQVPGDWTMQRDERGNSYGHPHYTNVQMPYGFMIPLGSRFSLSPWSLIMASLKTNVEGSYIQPVKSISIRKSGILSCGRRKRPIYIK